MSISHIMQNTFTKMYFNYIYSNILYWNIIEKKHLARPIWSTDMLCSIVYIKLLFYVYTNV